MKSKAEIENGFKETEIGLIPSDWEIQKIGDLDLEISDGNYAAKYPKREDFISDGVPFIRANNMTDYRIIWDDMKFISPSKHRELTKGHLKLNDVLITTRGELGKVSLVDERFVDSNINAQIVRVNTKETIDARYFLFCLASEPCQKQFLSLKTGTTLPQLPVGKLKFLLILLPSLPEQQKIAFVISKMQQAIEQQDKIIHITKELKKSLMNKLFTEGLHGEEQKQTEIGLIPKSWEIVNVENCLSDKAMQVGKIKKQDFKPFGKYAIVDQGQSLIAGYSDDATQVYQGDLPIIIFGDHTRILKFIDFTFICGADGTKVLLPRENINPKFLFYALIRLDIQSRGYNRHYRLLKEKEILLPKLEEQEEIADILSKVDIKIQQAESRKQALQALFKTMLNQLMTGRVRVKNLDIEVN